MKCETIENEVDEIVNVHINGPPSCQLTFISVCTWQYLLAL
jgi:hypothetical protein